MATGVPIGSKSSTGKVASDGHVAGTIDLQPDRRTEIFFYQGTTAYTAGYSLGVLEEGRLVKATLDGRPFLFERGGLSVSDLSAGSSSQRAWSWFCDDVDRDGEREIVQVHGRSTLRSGTWRIDAYDLEGSRLRPACERRGRLDEPNVVDVLEPVRTIAETNDCLGPR